MVTTRFKMNVIIAAALSGMFILSGCAQVPADSSGQIAPLPEYQQPGVARANGCSDVGCAIPAANLSVDDPKKLPDIDMAVREEKLKQEKRKAEKAEKELDKKIESQKQSQQK